MPQYLWITTNAPMGIKPKYYGNLESKRRDAPNGLAG